MGQERHLQHRELGCQVGIERQLLGQLLAVQEASDAHSGGVGILVRTAREVRVGGLREAQVGRERQARGDGAILGECEVSKGEVR